MIWFGITMCDECSCAYQCISFVAISCRLLLDKGGELGTPCPCWCHWRLTFGRGRIEQEEVLKEDDKCRV